MEMGEIVEIVEIGITREPIDAAALLARVADHSNGANILFTGTVRDHNDGRPVRGLNYEAYSEMAEPVLREIAGEAAERAGGARIAVVHRAGELELGDVSVAIAVSTAHRAEAYEASRYIIEQIKVRLPVWKNERYADGTAGWVEGRAVPAGGSSGE